MHTLLHQYSNIVVNSYPYIYTYTSTYTHIGIPVDLLDRMLIIRTMPYSLEEMVQIISIRAETESIQVDEEALAVLGVYKSIYDSVYTVYMCMHYIQYIVCIVSMIQIQIYYTCTHTYIYTQYTHTYVYICTLYHTHICTGEIGVKTSLRYAVQMLTPSRIVAQTSGHEIITCNDVEEVNDLFFDAKASARRLAESGEGYLT